MNANVKFIFNTNHISKISPGLRSRLIQIDFDPQNIEEEKYLKKSIGMRIWNDIIPKENIKIEKSEIVSIINKHFPDLFKEIYFINYFHGAGKKRTKSEVCKELGIEIFIDDSLYHANDISSIGTPVLLLNTPWNQGEVKPPITRVYSWKEIVEKLS